MNRKYSASRLLLIGLFSIVFSNSVNASLIRYDVEVRNANTVTPLGHMLFDVILGQISNRNIWNFLTQWEFMWEGQQFSDQNSTPATDGIFRINEQSLRVFADGIIVIQGSALQCALDSRLCPFLDRAPRFTRGDAEELFFSGFNNFDIPLISGAVPEAIIYTANRIVPVPVPSTIWMLTCALLLLRFTKRARSE
jgi:hypothetical protein